MEKKPNYLLQYGLFAAVASALVYILLYLGGVKAMMNPLTFLTYLVPITFAVLACIKQKKAQEGYLSFSEALKTAFGVAVFAALATTVLSYVLLNFIDPDFKAALQQASLETTEKFMKKFGAPQEQIDKALDEAAKTDSFSLGKIMIGFAFSCIFWFLISMLIAVIVKKKKPENGMPQSM